MIDMDDDLVELLLIPKIGRARAKALYSAGYRTAADIAKVSPAQLAKVPGINSELAAEVVRFCAMLAPAGPEEAPNQDILICPMCGSMVSAGSNSCGNCGIAFSDEVDEAPREEAPAAPDMQDRDGFWYRKDSALFICPLCGSMVAEGSQECPKCGVHFDAEDEDTEPTPAAGESDRYWYREDSRLFMCPNCGAFIKSDADSCGICGIVFEADSDEEKQEENACPMCMEPLQPGAAACGKCGFEFSRKEEDGFWYREETQLFMCPGCGSFIPKTATQCGRCGIVLEDDDGEEIPVEAPACPMCKAAISDGVELCAGCGFDFTEGKDVDGHWYKDRVALFICPGCGAFLSEAAGSCMNCGLVFEDGMESGEPEAGVLPNLEIDPELEEQIDFLIADDAFPESGMPQADIDPELEEQIDFLIADDATPGKMHSLPQDPVYLCPVCGAFIQFNLLKCPSCSAVFDDIEDMVLEPVGSVLVEVKNPLELAAEMAAEIEEIEAELLVPPGPAEEKRRGVSKDFLSRWKKLDPDQPQQAPHSREVDMELGLDHDDAGKPQTDSAFWENRARELATQGRLEEAIAFLDRAVESAPEREMEYKRLMLQLMGVGQDERPVDLTEVMSMDDIGELAVDEALMAQDSLERLAKIDLELESDKQDGALWQEKGEILEKLGRHEEAVACFDRSISISYSELRREQRAGIRKGVPQPGIGLTNGQGRVNGRVNGLLTQRKLATGPNMAAGPNMATGPDGLGKVNGLTNGKVNGLFKGRVNGLAEGKVNGLFRGKVNGLTNGQGLINGTGMINGGLVNGLGLVNGEGMVNGTGTLGRMRQRRRERIMWRYRLTAMVLLVTVVLMISMVGNLMVQEDMGRLRIDGNFSDWGEFQSYHPAMEGAPGNPALRILETRMTVQGGRLGAYIVLEADAFSASGGPNSVDSFWILADIDSDPSTGYRMGGLGLDLVAEIYGWNGTVMGSPVLRFNSGAAGDDWAGFTSFGRAATAVVGSEMEMSMALPRDMAGLETRPTVMVVAMDSLGDFHYTDYVMGQDLGGASAAFRQTGEDILQPGERIELGHIALASHSPGGATFTALEFLVDPIAAIDAPGITGPDSGPVGTDAQVDGNVLRLIFREPVHVPVNTTLTLGLEAGISAAGGTLGLNLQQALALDSTIHVRNPGTKRHNIGIPTGMIVDGAFGDWAGVEPTPDALGDVLGTDRESPFINGNIDIVDSRLVVEQGNTLFFQFSVQGVIMGGTGIPTVRHMPGQTIPSDFRDSDRDTVPDHLDPFPFDFNNDGTPDNQTWGTHPDGYTGYDVDGDGRTDYPHGQDMWLNTTIPDDFPEPHAGRFVSVYIGPVSPTHTENLGDDRSYVLIDSDGNPATGQNLRGGTGIDHVIVISGKNNRILASELYRYQPGGSETGWLFMGNVDAATDWTRLEGAVGLGSLGMAPGQDFTVYISTEDWAGARDVTETPPQPSAMAAGGTRSPAGDNVVLNEISAFGTAEWIELCNPTAGSINIGGWTLRLPSGNSGNYNNVIYTFPAGTAMGAFGSGSEYLVVSLNNLLPDGGRGLRLQSGTTVIDHVDYTAGSGTTHARFKDAQWGLPTDTDSAGDWYTSTTPTQGAPNDRRAPLIVVAKSGNTDIASPDGLVTYTVWYNNTGDGNARHVWVNDTLPAGMTFESSSEPYFSQSGQVYSWQFTNVAPGTHALTITARLDSTVSHGTVLTNTASLDYTDQLYKKLAASADSHDIIVVAPQPIISLSKAADPTTAFPGETVTFTIFYDNVGSGSAAHVWLNDTLPAGMTFLSASPTPALQSGQDVRWHFTDVGSGSHSVSLQARVDASVASGTVLTNTVTGDYKDSTGASLPGSTAQASVTVGEASSFIVINEVVSRPDPEWVELANPAGGASDISGWTLRTQRGGSGTYGIIYTFPAGTSIGAFGSGSEYLVAYLPGGSLNDDGRGIQLHNSAGALVDSTTYPAMVDGQSWARFKHHDTGKPDDGFYISNNNWLVPEGPTPGGPNDRKRPVMDINKTSDLALAGPGQTVTFTLTYRNTGDGNAKNVWVNDTLPAGLDLVSASPTPTTVSGQDLAWFFNNVVSGSTGYITITARMNSLPADGETLTNTATLVYHDALRRPMGSGSSSVSVTCSRPVITVSKVADVSTASVGDTIVYTIYYNNTGSANAGSVWVNDTLPAGVSYVSATPAPASISGQSLGWHFINVAPGSYSITVTVTVGAEAAGTLVNWVYLDYSSAHAWKLEQSMDSAVVEIPEMRLLALPIMGIMLIGLVTIRKRRSEHEKDE